MASQSSSWKLITAGLVVDGKGTSPVRNGAVLVEGSKVRQVGPANKLRAPEGAQAEFHDFPRKTLLPGLIDMHTHLNLPADGSTYEEVVRNPDEYLVLQSAHSAKLMLDAGVTTVGDCGAKGRTTFVLRQAVSKGLLESPRLMLCGRAVTVTRGHFWMMGGEADGLDGVRRVVRQLAHEGADFVKVMGTGGATAGTNPATPLWSLDELRLIVEEAHRFGKPVGVHNRGTQGVVNALEAGADILIHCDFTDSKGSWNFSSALAKRISRAGVWLNPTLHVVRAIAWDIKSRSKERPLTPQERTQLQHTEEWYRRRCEVTRRMFEEGVKIAAGSDSGPARLRHDQFYRELESLTEVGLTPMEAIVAATSNAASALGIGDKVGTLEAGKEADLLVVNGDPTKEINALSRVEAVFLGGQRVR